MWTVKFPPVAIRETAASMITCVTILLSSYTFNLSLRTRPSQRKMAKQVESAKLRAIQVVGKCYSASSAQSISGLFAFTFRIHCKA